MPGRHRKPRPMPNAAVRLARTSALTVATAPLAVVTGGAAFATTGAHAVAPSWADHHASSRWEDRDSFDRTASADSAADGSDDHRFRPADFSSDDSDSGDSDSGDSDSGDSGDSDGGDSQDSDSDASDAVDDAPGFARGSSGSGSRSTSAASTSDAKYDRIAKCESGQNWDANTGNGYRGGLQFSDSTWRGYGGRQYAPSADQASREEQIKVAKKVQRDQGWQAWPSCSRQAGYA